MHLPKIILNRKFNRVDLLVVINVLRTEFTTSMRPLQNSNDKNIQGFEKFSTRVISLIMRIEDFSITKKIDDIWIFPPFLIIMQRSQYIFNCFSSLVCFLKKGIKCGK